LPGVLSNVSYSLKFGGKVPGSLLTNALTHVLLVSLHEYCVVRSMLDSPRTTCEDIAEGLPDNSSMDAWAMMALKYRGHLDV
jgi:hypothetical protein